MSSLYWYIPLATGLLGIALFIYGRHGRRTGSAPHCRKCDYNLTGLTGEKCPECGSIIARVGTRIGARRGRANVAWLGLGVFLLSAAAMTISGIRWFRSLPYADLPTWWLLWEAQRTDRSRIYPRTLTPPGVDAYQELRFRLLHGKLSSDQSRNLIEIALNETMAWPFLYQDGEKTEDAAHKILEIAFHQMTPSQRQQYYENCAWVLWQARPRGLLADGIPLELSLAHRVKTDMEARLESIRIVAPDGTIRDISPIKPGPPGQKDDLMIGCALDLPPPFDAGQQFTKAWGYEGPPNYVRLWGTRWKWMVKPPTPGIWEFQCRVRLKLKDTYDQPAGKTTENCAYETVRTLTTKAEVLSQEPPNLIKLTCDAKLEAEVASHVSAFLETLDRNQGVILAQSTIQGFPLPVDLAFDVAYEVDGKRYPGGSFVVNRNRPPSTDVVPGSRICTEQVADPANELVYLPRNPNTRKVTLLLSPNPTLARQTVDIFEIWGKPIRKELDIPKNPIAPSE